MKIMVKINDWIILFEYFADFLVPLLLYTNKKKIISVQKIIFFIFFVIFVSLSFIALTWVTTQNIKINMLSLTTFYTMSPNTRRKTANVQVFFIVQSTTTVYMLITNK